MRWRLWRHFHALRFHNEAALQDATYPLVLYGNHPSWWDTFLKLPLLQRFGMEYWVMMEARTLGQLPWFRRCGVFGVDLESKADRARGLRYAAGLLNDAQAAARRRVLILYPHGRLIPQGEAWPPFERGLEGLLRLCPTATALPF
ncbi:MAG: 1-acyl-sn-glycerol-3-phosphate acyltransferase, partial [Verrucomicrobiota bacterium]